MVGVAAGSLPSKAEELLRLSLDVTEHLDPERYGPGSIDSAKSRAWASLGNALRVLADFRHLDELHRSVPPLDDPTLTVHAEPHRQAGVRHGRPPRSRPAGTTGARRPG